MNSLIEQNRQQLERLCRLRGARRIELFGSAAGRSDYGEEDGENGPQIGKADSRQGQTQ
jgi:hypothetical protein